MGWGTFDNNIIEEALDKTLYSVSAYENGQIIGYGRIIGDGIIFIYLQDIMVAPGYQHQNIGTEIVNKLLDKVKELKEKNPGLRAYLGAVKGKENFYKRFGFITRREADLGEGMILI